MDARYILAKLMDRRAAVEPMYAIVVQEDNDRELYHGGLASFPSTMQEQLLPLAVGEKCTIVPVPEYPEGTGIKRIAATNEPTLPWKPNIQSEPGPSDDKSMGNAEFKVGDKVCFSRPDFARLIYPLDQEGEIFAIHGDVYSVRVEDVNGQDHRVDFSADQLNRKEAPPQLSHKDTEQAAATKALDGIPTKRPGDMSEK